MNYNPYIDSPTRSFGGPTDLCPAHAAPYPVTAICFLDNNFTLRAVHGLTIHNKVLLKRIQQDVNIIVRLLRFNISQYTLSSARV